MILVQRFQVRNPVLFLDLVLITNDMMETEHRHSAEPGDLYIVHHSISFYWGQLANAILQDMD
jgi:hypothetical protein